MSETKQPPTWYPKALLAGYYGVAASAAILIGKLISLLFSSAAVNKFRFAMCIITIVLLAGAWATKRLKIKYSQRVFTFIFAVLLVMVMAQNSYKLQDYGIKRIHSWNMFHYVLGTKYFNEFGYFDLYNGALLADDQGKRIFSKSPHTRDMHTYAFVPIPEALDKIKDGELRNKFTDQRWKSFKKDLNTLLRLRKPRQWAGPIADRGFNPSPAWMIVNGPILNAVDVSKKSNLKKLAGTQWLLFLIMFGVCLWAFGLRTSLVSTLWFTLYFGNLNRIVGGYFPYDWLVFLVLAAAFYKKGIMAASGPFLAYPAMVRGFPGLFATYAGIQGLKKIVQLKWPEKKHTVFVAALLIACILLVALGSTTDRGFGAWLQWKEKISLHSQNHAISYNRIGLKFLFAKDYQDTRWTISLKQRERAIQRQLPYYKAAKYLLLLLTALAMIRRKPYDGFLLGLAIVFFSMLLSRYYFASAFLLLTWAGPGKWKIGRLLTATWFFALVAWFYYHRQQSGASYYETYYYFNLGVLAYFITLISYYLTVDIRHLFVGGAASKPPVKGHTP